MACISIKWHTKHHEKLDRAIGDTLIPIGSFNQSWSGLIFVGRCSLLICWHFRGKYRGGRALNKRSKQLLSSEPDLGPFSLPSQFLPTTVALTNSSLKAPSMLPVRPLDLTLQTVYSLKITAMAFMLSYQATRKAYELHSPAYIFLHRTNVAILTYPITRIMQSRE